MKSVLLIEDNDNIRFLTKTALERKGYYVTECNSSAMAIKELHRGFQPHITLLDLMLPDDHGLNLIPVIKKFSSAPIIIVSAKADLIEKVVGLGAGADDYVTKPFEIEELCARIDAHLRRYIKVSVQSFINHKKIKFGEFIIDLEELQVFNHHGQSADLTLGEFYLLKALISEPGKLFSREELLDKTRGYNLEVSDRVIDTQITRIRKKLNIISSYDSKVISAVKGLGYLCTSDLEVLE